MELTREQVEEQAHEKLSRVREELVRVNRLYGYIALTRETILTWRVPCAATDGKKVKFNPQYVLECSEEKLAYLYKHEFWHVLGGDHLRITNVRESESVRGLVKRLSELVGERNVDRWVHMLFNVASDYVINTEILYYGERLACPEGLLFDRDVHGKTKEQVFLKCLKDAIEELENEQAGSGQGESEDEESGQGESGQGEPGLPVDGESESEGEESESEESEEGESEDEGESEGESESESEGEDESESESAHVTTRYQEKDVSPDKFQERFGKDKGVQVEELKNEDGSELTETEKREVLEDVYREVQQATHAASKAGQLSEATKVRIEEITHPTPSAQEVLQKFVQQAVSRTDYSYRVPNKRYRHLDLYLPSLQEHKHDALLAMIDVSGSVSDAMVRDFVAELKTYLDALPHGAELTVLYVDTCVAGVEVISPGDSVDSLKPARVTGGTRFDPGFRWIQEQGACPQGVVYYTDGCSGAFPKPEQEPGCPVVWVLHESAPYSASDFKMRVPFGDVLKMGNGRKEGF